ncbi:MAG: hypothetical protein JSS29_18960 [Proteobacteria bacterium]|nr:hypothetical protein [Pseudomonadota bacterium]
MPSPIPLSRLVRTIALLAALLALTGCSLLSIKSPERPLTPRELNTRIVTRLFVAEFNADLEQCADDIARGSSELPVRMNALRWKIAATTQSEHAALQLAPLMGLIDVWAFTDQMQAFLAPGGAGAALFGPAQSQASGLADRYATQARELAQRLLTPGQFAKAADFIGGYVREHPLVDVRFARVSVVQAWAERGGADTPLAASLGTIPEALADTSDRVQILSQSLPSEGMWRTQLELEESGVSGDDVKGALRRLDERLERLTRTAESSPELVHEAVRDVRRSVLEIISRLDGSTAETLKTLRAERLALSETLSSERAAVLAAADTERQAIAVDVGHIAQDVVAASAAQARKLALEATLLIIVLAVVLLGLPFAAGYYVGRARVRRGSAPS